MGSAEKVLAALYLYRPEYGISNSFRNISLVLHMIRVTKSWGNRAHAPRTRILETNLRSVSHFFCSGA